MERRKHLQLEQEVRAQLLAMSAATIDRLLCAVREHAYGGRKKKVALNRIRKMVPVRTFADWGQDDFANPNGRRSLPMHGSARLCSTG
jgi:hypothetical protein